MKQTAVEWLIKELVNQKLVKIDKLSTYYWYKNYATTFELLCENARKKEKNQIIEAQSYAISHADMTNNKGYFDCEKYYNETYKKD